jgi:hypothetical protein
MVIGASGASTTLISAHLEFRTKAKFLCEAIPDGHLESSAGGLIVSVSIRIIRAFRTMLSQEPDEIHPVWGASGEVNPPWTEASIDAEDDAL